MIQDKITQKIVTTTTMTKPRIDGTTIYRLESLLSFYWISLNTYAMKIIHNNDLCGINDMCLIYNGKVLCPYNALVDYYSPVSTCRRSNDTPITIHASYPIRGGCFIISFSILITLLIAMCMSVCTCGLSLAIIPILAPFLFILPLFCL